MMRRVLIQAGDNFSNGSLAMLVLLIILTAFSVHLDWGLVAVFAVTWAAIDLLSAWLKVRKEDRVR